MDLCAAPGGKSGGIAARLAGQGLLVANEVVPGRAKTLRFTLERLGVANGVVTCARPDVLCEALPGYFHRVLVDAPCSGEGMFRKDPAAVAAWSPQHVAPAPKGSRPSWGAQPRRWRRGACWSTPPAPFPRRRIRGWWRIS